MKRYQLIFLSIFSALLLSLPWLELLPGWILFIAFLPLLIVEDQLLQKKDKTGSIVFFGYAYSTFCVWNALTTWWIMYATLAGMILVVFLNACFMGTVWWLYHLFNRKTKAGLSYIALLAFWLAFEFVHYHWEIEWPWLTIGNGFANQVKMVQWYEYSGVLGGSLWVLVVNLLVFRLYKRLGSILNIGLLRPIIILLAVIFIPMGYSYWRYANYEEKGKNIELVILQPNIDPYSEKFGSVSAIRQMEQLVELADSLVTGSTNYVVAPETAIHPIWENERMINHPYIVPFRDMAMRFPKLQFVVGATTRILFRPEENMPKTVRKFNDQDLYYDVYNSALQIDQSRNVQVYHKSVLVSGVEKMPFSKYLSFIEDFIIDLGGTTGSLGSQEEPSVFVGKNDVKVAPVICYESVFGGYLTEYIKRGANLIFVITNDGWWRNTPGFRQHLSFSRLRAIETRRSIARSANTGISAIINQRGDIVQQTSWWVRTAIKGTVHPNEELTFYARFGDFIGRISVFTSILLSLYLISSMGYKKDKKNPH